MADYTMMLDVRRCHAKSTAPSVPACLSWAPDPRSPPLNSAANSAVGWHDRASTQEQGRKSAWLFLSLFLPNTRTAALSAITRITLLAQY